MTGVHAEPFVISGTGMVTRAGVSAAAVIASIGSGRSFGTAPSGGFHAAPIDDFDPKAHIVRKGAKDLSRTSQLACAAAAQNAAELLGVPPDDVGVVLGSAWGAVSTVIAFEREAHVQGPRFVDPILFTETVSNVPAGQVAIHYGWTAFNATVSSGSASGLAAIRQAIELLEDGRGAVAVAGGADEMNLAVLGALSSTGSLPGGAYGEAACFLTIESEDHARRRGAHPAARFLASGHRFRSSMASLVREVVAAAGVAPDSVDLIVTSAAGGNEPPGEESAAVAEVFGDSPVPVVTPKTLLGETWGASGAIAVAVAIEAMRASAMSDWPRRVPRFRPMRTALILDRSDSGHQLAAVVALAEADSRAR